MVLIGSDGCLHILFPQLGDLKALRPPCLCAGQTESKQDYRCPVFTRSQASLEPLFGLPGIGIPLKPSHHHHHYHSPPPAASLPLCSPSRTHFCWIFTFPTLSCAQQSLRNSSKIVCDCKSGSPAAE